jgi:hypothetical protein
MLAQFATVRRSAGRENVFHPGSGAGNRETPSWGVEWHDRIAKTAELKAKCSRKKNQMRMLTGLPCIACTTAAPDMLCKHVANTISTMLMAEEAGFPLWQHVLLSTSTGE